MTGPADPALSIARAQLKLGHDVLFGYDTKREGNMARKLREAEIPAAEGLSLCTIKALSTSLADRRRLRVLAPQFDIVHSHTSHDHGLMVSFPRTNTLVRTIHHGRSTRRRGLQGYAYARTEGLITVTQAHQTALLQNYPKLNADKTTVIGGAVDEVRFHLEVDGRSMRTKHHLDPADLVFGIVARIKPGRGHALLARAFRNLTENGALDARLVLIGTGEGLPATRNVIDQLGLSERVRYYGFCDDDLPEAIASCDFTVLLEEGNDATCRAILESMALGVPVIAASHPAIRDALEGADAGLLFPIRDEDALVARMREAAAWSKERKMAVGQNARKRIIDNHTEDARGQAVLDFYERVRAKQC